MDVSLDPPVWSAAALALQLAQAAEEPSLTAELSLRLPATPLSCRQARHAVRDFCLSQDLAHLADDAELLTSEVVANAVSDATAEISVHVTKNAGVLLVSVGEHPTSGPTVRASVAAATAEHGRGIFLVSELAGDWGTSSTELGKSVWFVLPGRPTVVASSMGIG